MRDRKKIRQREQAPANQSVSAVNPGETADAGHDAMLSWCDRQYDEVPGIAQAVLGFLIGSGIVVVPVAAVYLLINLLKAVISFLTGEPPSWLIPDHDALFIIGLFAVGFGSCSPLMCIFTKEIIRYDIDLQARQLSLHQARFPNRIVILTIPFSAIASIAPYTQLCPSEKGGFYFTHVNTGGKLVTWKTRDAIPITALDFHAQVLRDAFGERLHEWEYHDT